MFYLIVFKLIEKNIIIFLNNSKKKKYNHKKKIQEFLKK